MNALTGPWPAPAKINLFLHVTGRRADGYHELQTVFQLLDFGDALWIEPTDDGALRREAPLPGVPESADLVLRAAQRLRAVSGCRMGARFRLEKRLPMGGGLGGGSSNAATVLVALNRLWGLDWDTGRLAELGLGLGADVPVFVHGRSAWAEGVGERLAPVELPERWYLVLTPDASVSTAEVFRSPKLTRQCTPITIADFLSGAGTNVCEPVVRESHPEVDRALRWLGERAPARMTGTGASVFAAFADEASARRVLGELPVAWRGFVARGVNRSPLLQGPAA